MSTADQTPKKLHLRPPKVRANGSMAPGDNRRRGVGGRSSFRTFRYRSAVIGSNGPHVGAFGVRMILNHDSEDAQSVSKLDGCGHCGTSGLG